MSVTIQTAKRLPSIKQGLLNGLTSLEIARKCGVTEKTIDRDLAQFRQSGEFEDWLREEWTRLHYVVIHTNPELAYTQLSRLLGQTLTKRIEALTYNKTELNTTQHLDLSKYNEEDKTAILDAYRRIHRQESSSTRPGNFH